LKVKELRQWFHQHWATEFSSDSDVQYGNQKVS